MARAIAFLDVLGFKSRLDAGGAAALADLYASAVGRVDSLNQRFAVNDRPAYLRDHKPGDPWCFREIFSDSIILIALDESPESCLKLLLYARLLFIAMLASDLAVRGAISAGELVYRPDQSVTVGGALTEAYLLEQQQQWAGVCIADSVWEHFPELVRLVVSPNQALHYYFLEYAIPWKSDPQPASRILNWRFNSVFAPGSRKLLEDARLHEAPEKFNNVIKYLEFIRESGAISIGSGAPAECNVV